MSSERLLVQVYGSSLDAFIKVLIRLVNIFLETWTASLKYGTIFIESYVLRLRNHPPILHDPTVFHTTSDGPIPRSNFKTFVVNFNNTVDTSL